jgi:hypothetical protein
VCLVEIELSTQEMAIARRVGDQLRRDALTGGMRISASALSEEGWVAVNVEVRDPVRVGLSRLVDRVAELAAENGASIRALRIESLVHEAAVPADGAARTSLVDFAPERQVYERLLASRT